MATVFDPSQKIFFLCGPRKKEIFTAALIVRVQATWKIKISLAPPEIVTSVGMTTALVNLYRPGVRVLPPIFPAPRFRKFGLERPAASVYAVCISPTAVVNLLALVTLQGRGPAASTVYIVPDTSAQLTKRAAPVIGLVPISPVIAD